jgi:hypothetical protein
VSAALIQFLSKTVIHPYGTTLMRCAQSAEYLRSRGVDCFGRSITVCFAGCCSKLAQGWVYRKKRSLLKSR